jgi:hypothetical protein
MASTGQHLCNKFVPDQFEQGAIWILIPRFIDHEPETGDAVLLGNIKDHAVLFLFC